MFAQRMTAVIELAIQMKQRSGMKKTVVAIFLSVVLSLSLAFARDSGSGNLIESIRLGAGYDLMYASGKFDDGKTSFDNVKAGFGLSAGMAFDLSAIPDFMTGGWYSYLGLDFYFSDGLTFRGQKHPAEGETVKGSVGMKVHAVMMHHHTFDTKFNFYFGAGLAFDWMTGRLTQGITESVKSASAWGVSLYAEVSYRIINHLSADLTVIPDITFITKMSSAVETDGYRRIETRTGFGFGVSVSAKLGLKYIF